MQIAKIIAALGVAAMLIAIGYGFIVGDFAAEGSQLLKMPWGIVSVVDLYTGFVLLAMWIIFREPSGWRAAGWVALLLALGNLTGAAYVLWALWTCQNDWHKFFLGHRAAKRA